MNPITELFITEMTIKQFRELPCRDWREDVGEFDSLVILPATLTDGLHDSGYRYLDFVACIEHHPVCRLSGGSDVLHIDGIGGYGVNYEVLRKPVAWNIDCLPKSGLLHIFVWGHKLTCGGAYSSFEVYATKKETK